MRRGTGSVTRQMMELWDRKPRGASSPVAVRMPGKVPVLLTFVFPLGDFRWFVYLVCMFLFFFFLMSSIEESLKKSTRILCAHPHPADFLSFLLPLSFFLYTILHKLFSTPLAHYDCYDWLESFWNSCSLQNCSINQEIRHSTIIVNSDSSLFGLPLSSIRYVN